MISLKDNRIVEKMLDRLFAALVNGPSLNARPHSSRQRIDLLQLAKLQDRTPEDVLRELLGEKGECKVVARVAQPKKRVTSTGNGEESVPLTPEEKAAAEAYSQQQSVLTKIRSIAEDARTYENDTGVHVLQIGFPLLSLPPGSFGSKGFTRRILAPIAFISLSLTSRGGPTPTVAMECRNEGADLVQPNIALLAWLESQAGKPVGELDGDETGARAWDELAQIVARVAHMIDLATPAEFASGEAAQASLALRAAPRADDEDNKARIVPSAVIGLFPLANQGLIRDTQALLAGEPVAGPIESFVNVGVSLDAPPTQASAAPDAPQEPIKKETRRFADERLVAPADPCQARSVKQARTSRGLVIHGPPGTGKSQTIANIIGDHLARGERVLFVCDKRTALDVVQDRLTASGLGDLCAVVHDPQRDQRELYKSIREQLDNLTELRTDASAAKGIERCDHELQSLHAELAEYHAALMSPPAGAEVSFHEMMGRWLELPSVAAELDESLLAGVSPQEMDSHGRALHEIFERGTASDYANNKWNLAAGVALAKFLATPMDRYRQAMAKSVAAAEALDATASPTIPPFAADEDVLASARSRKVFADRLEDLAKRFEPAALVKWSKAGIKSIHTEAATLGGLESQIQVVAQGPLDPELSAAFAPYTPLSRVNLDVAALNAYIASAASIFGFLAFGKKKAATAVLAPLGLTLSPENATRAREFLLRVKARMLLRQSADHLADTANRSDDEVVEIVKTHHELFELLMTCDADAHLKPIAEPIAAAFATRESIAQLIDGLRASQARAKRIVEFDSTLAAAELFANAWLTQVRQHVRKGSAVAPHMQLLHDTLATLENVLRIREGLTKLPEPVAKSAAALLKQSVTAEDGLVVMKKASLAGAIARRLQSDPRLQAADSQKLRSAFTKYSTLDAQKKQLTRAAVIHRWGSKQKDGLLAMTGSRLNSAGADLRRRFTLRGERAMRLRQVIAVGQDVDGGDPLFDLRPVWMASPETVAQIFPRKALFDVVVFDEASQCRLEEALPVLLRAKRVVIAGDPKQLPPSRFFESAVATSDEDEIVTDQQLFESQQGEIEDLLGAALNVEIDESYLDVHYRSRNADLIDFSNRHFYGARLQPIPGHPANRARYAPLTLYRADGVYEDRQNESEAEKVCQIVRDLLRRADPPTIGIACFNITQRDLILEKLDDLAEADATFARALADARSRHVNGSFQGLFVKNLENVQGDERDHIIISTTYGPDAKGKFYRRFGPLALAGGGRRLNVLVTRARDEVHIVTSIPPSEYRGLPPIPAGQSPGGPWLLFSYLAEAERLAEVYEENHRILSAAKEQHQPMLEVNRTRFPSRFCESFGKELVTDHATGATVHWGNDGFCVDLALHHPQRMEDVTIGLLCDTNRFAQAADPVEWEVFRTMVLESQNWHLHRIWTPQFFRDRRGCVEAIMKDVQRFLASDTDPDALPVSKTSTPPA